MPNNQISINADHSLEMSWRKIEELPAYKTFYDQIDVSVGYRYGLIQKEYWMSHFAPSFHFSKVTGGIENRFSHREYFGVELGYKQSLLKYLFVQGAFILGFVNSSSNFGDGTIPYDQTSTNAKLKGMLGAQICSKVVCPAAYISGSYERPTSFVKEDYFISAMNAGLMISLKLD